VGPRPVFGVLSILLPAIGAGFWWLVESRLEPGRGPDGYAEMLHYHALLIVSGLLVLGGIVCGLRGLVRRERWKGFAIVGIMLNLAVVLRFV
jgi:hypothetical protein